MKSKRTRGNHSARFPCLQNLTIARAAAALAMGAAVLLSSCGGGGGGGPNSTSTTPGDGTQTVTTSITPAGGNVSVGNQVVATVAPNTLLATGDVSVTLSPKADAEALSTNDLTLSLPADQVTTSPTGEVTLYFYPDAVIAGAASVGHALSLTNGLDPATLLAKVRVGSKNAVAFVVPVVWDAAKEAYAVSLNMTQLASAGLQWTGRIYDEALVEPIRDVGINLWLKQSVDDSSTPRVLYKWTASADLSPVPVSTRESVPPGKVPLILVHGIVMGPPVPLRFFHQYQCGTNNSYRETWKPTGKPGFADFFFGPSGAALRSIYELYTFQYPTNQPIARNGRWLAQRISEHFGNQPVVVVSHSMGGLVTRAADLLYSKQGLNGINALWDIDIHRVITLVTPHLGVPSTNAAIFDQKTCLGPDTHQGALDLRLTWKADGKFCDNPRDNPLLCDSNTGLNTHTEHLKKYIAYSANFDIAGIPSFIVSQPVDWLRFAKATVSLCAFDSHGPYCYLRMIQVVSQALLDPPAPSGGDGVTLVNSQRMQEWNGSSWADVAGRFLKQRGVYPNTDHSSIHDDQSIFENGIRPDLLEFYGTAMQIAAPTGVSTNAGNGQASITWNAVWGATSYNLYMASVAGVTKANYASLPGGSKSTGVTSPYVQTGLTNGTAYYFIVTAVNANGESVESNEVSATPQASGTPIVLQPANDSGVQDIWTTSVFSYSPGPSRGPGGGLNDDRLVVGGWGDLYYSLIQFDLSQLPSVASKVELQLYLPQVRASGTTALYVDRISQAWDWRTQGTGTDRLRLWWADRPSAVQWIQNVLPAPTAGQWYVIDITALYNAWQAGTYPNYGVQLRPATNNNTWADFSSSNSVDAAHRPKLVVTPLSSPPVTILDGDFAAWPSFSFVNDDPLVVAPGPGTSIGSATRVASGGNPGAYLFTSHSINYGDTVWTGGIKTDYAYDPAVEGAIATLSVNADVIMFGAGASAWQLVVEQAGTRFYSFPFGVFSGGWTAVTTSGLTAANFDTNPWAGSGGVVPDGNQPDFGPAAPPLRFGFLVGNTLPSPGTVNASHGMDNFNVTIAK